MPTEFSDSSPNGKSSKPRPDFPLFAHSSGRWCKKVKGRFCYFGKVSDDTSGDKALALWLEQKDYLLAGRKPVAATDGLTVERLCFKFLDSKAALAATGELSPRSLENYRQVCKRLSEQLGRHRSVSSLVNDDFKELREELAKNVGVVSLRNNVRQMRMVFKYGYDSGLLDRPVRFGVDFKIPAKRHVKREKRLAGKRMFEADELRALIEAAPQPLRAIILLGINTGCGSTDCSDLQRTDINLESGWLDYPRRKTEVDRRAKLWPETIEAVREAMAKRPRAAVPDDDGCVFLTKYGQRFVRIGAAGGPIDSIGGEFTKLIKSPRCPKCGTINRVARGGTVDSCRSCQWTPSDDEPWQYLRQQGIYACRHGFQTIGDETKDFPAVRRVMGHSGGSMSDEYRENISDERLERVADHVRLWLWPDVAKPAAKRATKKRPAK